MATFAARAAPEPRLDFLRPAADAAALFADPVSWGWGVPRGDGHTIIVLPGLGGSDTYLTPLRGWLRRVGYRAVRSGLNPNRGWSPERVAAIAELARSEAQRTGRPVTLIGHSMGGNIARSAARLVPEAVRQVITLGAPLAASRGTMPAGVALTAIYSRSDPIVSYPAALARDRGATNVEVRSSHTGMATNREVYRELGRVLAAKVERTTFL
ncbi:MAG: alpha/beta hydrolase [Dehalococcoidia bacterium]